MKAEHIIERQGKKMALYAGLLDEAHYQGLDEIDTELLQIPTEVNGNVAIVKALVTIEGKRFSGIGDASPQNVGRNIAPHIIRMAETRAKARAIRDGINVGEAVDETDDEAAGPAPAAPTELRGAANQISKNQGEQIIELSKKLYEEDSASEALKHLKADHLPEDITSMKQLSRVQAGDLITTLREELEQA